MIGRAKNQKSSKPQSEKLTANAVSTLDNVVFKNPATEKSIDQASRNVPGIK